MKEVDTMSDETNTYGEDIHLRAPSMSASTRAPTR